MTSRKNKKTLDSAWTDPDCPTARAIDIIGDKWSLLIIRDAMNNAHTFTEFQRRTGIARNILSDRLSKLTSWGILKRIVTSSGRRYQYDLSPMGHDLFLVILALRQWGENYTFTPDEIHSILVDRYEIPLPKYWPTDSDENPLSAHNTHILDCNKES